MTKHLHALLVALTILMFSYTSWGQEFTTEGKDFWFGFMENTAGGPPDTLVISLSSRFNATATVSIPLNGWSQTVNIPANTSITMGIPRNIAMASGCGTKSPMGCHIVATERISAYALNFQTASADATLLIPNTTIGDKYYVNTYKETNPADFPSQMLIVAAYPNTTIEITPTVATTCGNVANTPFQISLNQGEVYYLNANGDLTGTFVQSVDVGQGCKKFVLFTGSFCSNVGNSCCCDHLFDVMFYADSWGKNYILPNIATRNRTKFKVVAQKNGTQVSINGGPIQNLNAGQSFVTNLNAHGSLTSNEPVEVLQLSFSSDDDNAQADPFMITLGPNEQTLNEITFNTLFNSGNTPSYYVSIITKTANTSLLTLDGGAVAGFTPVASNNTYSIANVSIAQGSHTVLSDSGFLAYVYEYASYESFGYSAGANLSNLFARFEYASSSFDTIFCPGDTVNFVGIGDPSIISYEWDFGDGDTAIAQSPKHAYDSLGRYTVKMIIQRQNSCEKDTIPGAVNIVGPTVAEVPDDTICQGEGPLTITTTPTNPTDTVKWSTGAVGNSIIISPQVTTSYYVYAVSNKCPGIRDTFTITIFDPQVDFTTNAICLGNPITFYPSYLSAVVNTFSWDFGDGTTSSLDTVVHVYATPGTYNVRLIIVDSAGCSDTVVRPIVINPVVNINVVANDVCAGQAVVFNNTTTATTGSVTSEWYYGDASAMDPTYAPAHLYADTGTYNYTYIAVATGGCSDTLNASVRVYPQTQAAFSAPNQCMGTAVQFTNNTFTGGANTSYQWNFGDGQTSTQTNPLHTYSTADTFNVQLISTTPQGCNDTVYQDVIVFPIPQPDFVSDSVCLGASITFTDNSSIQWGTYTSSWNFGDGNSSALQSPTHLYADTGNYSVKLIVTSNNNCSDSATKIARVHPYPIASFIVSDVCNDSTWAGVNTSSIPTGTISYNWTFGDGNSSTVANPIHNYTSTGTYTTTLIVTSAFGCADTLSDTATVILGGILNYTAPAVCQGFTTVFTDSTVLKTGTSVSNYLWRLGDGTTANTQNTTHVYANYGSYTTSLVLDYGNNCLDSVSKQVIVHPNPTAAFTVSDVCNDSTWAGVNTSSIPTGAISYNWAFGDGNSSTVANPIHNYTSTGTYTTTLIVTSAFACADTLTDTATVILGGVLDFTAPPVCQGFTTVFTDATALKTGTVVNNYSWDFGDATTASTQNATNVYASAGNYTARLLLDYGNNCFDSVTKQVVVYANPTAEFTNTTVCERYYTDFTNQSQPGGLAYNWAFGDGNTSTAANPQHLYSGDGTYAVTLIVATPELCYDTVTHNAIVLPVGNAAFSVAPVCFNFPSVFINQTDSTVNPVATYIWTLGDGTGSSQHSPTKVYGSAGNYQVTLITNFVNGCADTTVEVAVVNPTPVMTSTTRNVSCFSFSDGDITLNPVVGSAPFAYQWNTNAVSGALNNIIAGDYSVTFTDAKGCVDSLEFTITQPDSLALSYFLDSISCRGLSDGKIELVPTGGTKPYEFIWTNGVTDFIVDNLPAGEYGVTVTDANLCQLIRAILLPDPPKFTVDLPVADTIQLGESITLQPTVPYSTVRYWSWTPGSGLSCVDCESPVATPYNDITYHVYAVSEKGCADSAFIRVNVDHNPVVFVPNMFTPNGDGLNDDVKVFSTQVRDLDFKIFNRWGEKVYEGHNIEEGWNGVYQGKVQDTDAFVYVVVVTFLNGNTKTKTGSITLVR